MQVTETLSEGLKREYKVVLAAADLATKVEAQLDELRAKAHINGFRPGKVPVAHLKRLYGRSIMADVMQEAMNEANRKIIEENNLRLATPPKVDLIPTNDQELAEAFEAKADLAYKVAVEVLPKFEIGGFSEIGIERLVAEIPDADVDNAIARIAEQNRNYAPKEGDGVVAAKGDKVVLDFVGKIGDEAFEGGTAQDIDLVLGSGSFIPGFEDQIEGMKLGEQKAISVTFPEDYAAANLAGKPATFDVTLKGLRRAGGACRSTMLSRRASALPISARCARRSKPRLKANRPRSRGANGSVSFSTRSTRNSASNCRKPSSLANSRRSGARPMPSAKSKTRASPMKERPKRRSGRISSASPNVASGSACFWPKSAKRPA